MEIFQVLIDISSARTFYWFIFPTGTVEEIVKSFKRKELDTVLVQFMGGLKRNLDLANFPFSRGIPPPWWSSRNLFPEREDGSRAMVPFLSPTATGTTVFGHQTTILTLLAMAKDTEYPTLRISDLENQFALTASAK